MSRIRQEGGFTIVEVMVATAIMLAGVLGTLAMMDTANKRTRTAGDRQAATALARDVIEAVRGLSYRDVSDDTSLVGRLQEEAGLEGNGSATDWRVERSGTTYAVRVEVCALDDPADERGPHTGTTFCPDTGAAGTEDGSPADYKRVTVRVSWSGGSGEGTVEQASLMASRGGGDAPAITSLVLTSPTSRLITSTATTSASFSLETSVTPDSVVWLVDGAQQGVASGYGTDFDFQWSVPSADGTYKVEAQAFDSSAVAGETKFIDMVVNRYVPAAPTGFNAGRNGSVVEAEWNANPEQDIVGYRVYRRVGATGSSSLACETEQELSCVDASPPSGGSSLYYWVVALDRNETGTADREGGASSAIDVNRANSAPNAPTDLVLEPDEEGRLVLSWTAPATADPDSGDGIAFYRIYRGGTSVADRYDRTGTGTTSTWLDDEPGDGTASYWITAVDTHLHESAIAGPVRLVVAEPEPEAGEVVP